MLRTRILILALIPVFLAVGRARAENAILYEAIDAGGSSLAFDEGEVDEMGRGWNDEVSSVWVRNGYQFEGFVAINFQGANCWVVAPADGGAPAVSHSGFTYKGVNGGWLVNIHKDGWNDILSSYKVTRLQ